MFQFELQYSFKVETFDGFCLDEKGNDVNMVNNIPGSFTEEECLEECKNKRNEFGVKVKACEWKGNKECIYHTRPVKYGNGDSNYRCSIFNGGKISFAWKV